MSGEASVRTSLQILKGNLNYQSQPTAFQASVSVANGPTPGVLNVLTTGTDVDFSQLTSPGLCRLMNLDLTNYVIYGIWDGVKFHPFGELLPGETYVVRLARDLEEVYSGGGTGSDLPTARVRLKANSASCKVLVEAFDR